METQKHVKQTPKTKKTMCSICMKVIIGSSYKFKAHLYHHSAVTSRFKCSDCSKEFFRPDTFARHQATHSSLRKYFTCDHCDRNFIDRRNLILHLRIHDEDFSKSVKQFKCLVCSAQYCENRLLKYHIRKHHFNLKGKEAVYVKKKLNETWFEHVSQSAVCVEMTKVNDNKIIIKKCAKTEDLRPKNEVSNNKTEFQDYISSMFAKKNVSQYSKAVCDYCKKEMLKKSLHSHIRERHLKLRRFKCTECNTSYNRHYQLINHICGKTRRRRK